MKIMMIVAMLLLAANQASAQMALRLSCGPEPVLLARLAERYHEMVVWRGDSLMGHMRFLMTASEGGSWTWLMALDNGTACIVAAGRNGRADNGV